MFIYLVDVRVKSEYLEPFKAATLENAAATVREPKNLRFDVLQQEDDPSRFRLYEVYEDQSGLEAHRQTEHYQNWKSKVEPWMAEPRHATKYRELFFGSSK